MKKKGMNEQVKLNVTNSVVSDEHALIYVQSRFRDGVEVFNQEGGWVRSLDLPTFHAWCMKIHRGFLYYGTTAGKIGVYDLGSHQNVRTIEPCWKLWDAGHDYDGRYTVPTGFALNAEELFVVDTYEHTILCLSLTGELLYKKTIEELIDVDYCPVRIDVDDQHIVISFAEQNAVALFDREFEKARLYQEQGSEDGQFEIPWDVCLSGGHLFVSDLYNHRVEEFDLEFQYIRSYGHWGSRLGEFDYVYSFEVFEQSILFSDTWNHGFQIWKKTGADYKPEIKVSLPDLKSVLRPCRVNVIDDSIVVTDYLNHCFKFFDSDLNECQKVIGRLGFDIGEFRYPTGITQGAGCLYATDIRSGRVTKISSDEECIEFLAGHQGAAMSPDSAGFLASFDQTKEAGDMIYLATDIAVDEQQNVYVADIGHQAVLKFDQQGRYLGKIGYGVLAVENKTSFIGCEIYSGVLYVTNPANSCVNIFDLNGNCLDCIEPLVDGLSLQCPTGISVSHSLIAIADRLNHRIVLVRRDDRSVFSIGKLGNQTRQFCAPWDVALIEESLVVVDSLNNRLQKISL